MRNEVQVIITAMSSDGEHQLDVLAINAASCALTISDVPWDGPVGAVRVGYIDGEFVLNPTATRDGKQHPGSAGSRHRRRHPDGGSGRR